MLVRERRFIGRGSRRNGKRQRIQRRTILALTQTGHVRGRWQLLDARRSRPRLDYFRQQPCSDGLSLHRLHHLHRRRLQLKLQQHLLQMPLCGTVNRMQLATHGTVFARNRVVRLCPTSAVTTAGGEGGNGSCMQNGLRRGQRGHAVIMISRGRLGSADTPGRLQTSITVCPLVLPSDITSTNYIHVFPCFVLSCQWPTCAVKSAFPPPCLFGAVGEIDAARQVGSKRYPHAMHRNAQWRVKWRSPSWQCAVHA